MRRTLIASVSVLVVLAAGYVLLLRPEPVTVAVVDVYATDAKGAHQLPEEDQRPELLTTTWVVDRGGLTYQAHEGKFVIGKRYRCSVHTPGSGIELRSCKEA